MKSEPPLIKRIWRTSLILFLIVITYFLLPLIYPSIPPIVEHLLIMLMAMIGVHLLERAFLYKDISIWSKSSLDSVFRTNLNLINDASNCGLEKIYQGRDRALEDIISDMNGAKKRIWILGIALSEILQLEDIIDICREKDLSAIDLKILLLDALRSPAIMRSFLESTPDNVRSMLNFDIALDLNHPYFNTKLYTEFLSAVGSFNINPVFANNVKFYAHNPNCWLVIIDDNIYFEPYTFGRSKIKSKIDNLKLGGLLPVLKFNKNKDEHTYSIYEDHFSKLWFTTTSDIFKINARNNDRDNIIKEIFRARKTWLKFAYYELYEEHIHYDRKFVRHDLSSKNVNINIKWDNNYPSNFFLNNCQVLNCSNGGLALNLSNVNAVPKKLHVGTTGIRILDEENIDDVTARVMLTELKAISLNHFVLKWTNGNPVNKIGLSV